MAAIKEGTSDAVRDCLCQRAAWQGHALQGMKRFREDEPPHHRERLREQLREPHHREKLCVRQ